MPRRKKSAELGLVDRFMNEWIVCGGLVVRRHEAHRWLKAAGHDPRPEMRKDGSYRPSAVDYFAFHPRALDLPLDAPTRTVTVPGAGDEPAVDVEIYDGPGGRFAPEGVIA